jgi:hypothetical protein
MVVSRAVRLSLRATETCTVAVPVPLARRGVTQSALLAALHPQ